jgi:hypothetical protein
MRITIMNTKRRADERGERGEGYFIIIISV